MNSVAPREQRHSAHAVVAAARRDGLLTKMPCQKCGAATAVAHHEDYSQPLEVVWLCPTCHKARHRKLGWGNRAALGEVRVPRSVSFEPELIERIERSANERDESFSKWLRDAAKVRLALLESK